MLIGFSLLLAFNQVVIKVANGGFQPVYLAALRSLGAVFVFALWMRWRGKPMLPARENLWPSVLLGALFSAEFIFLFLALDLTTVSRVSILFYSMLIWLDLLVPQCVTLCFHDVLQRSCIFTVETRSLGFI